MVISSENNERVKSNWICPKKFFLIKRQTDVNSNVELEAKLPNTVGAT
jgi:hypothetical protein